MSATPVSNQAPKQANNSALTYVTPSFPLTTAQQANGSHVRLTVAGEQSLVFYYGQIFGAGLIYNVHVGANGNTSDTIIFSHSDSNPTQQFFKQFLIGLRSNGANGVWIATTQPSPTGNASVSPNTVNVSTSGTNYVGLSIKTSSTVANSFANVEMAVVEQIL